MTHPRKSKLYYFIPQCIIALILLLIAWGPLTIELGMRRAESWLRQVRDIATTDHRWDFIRWYSYAKVGYAYVVFDGGVESEAALADFRRAVEQSHPPVPVSWHVQVLTNGVRQSR